MSEHITPVTGEEGHRMEPGLGLALLTVLVMLLVTAVLAGLIYLLMVAISPIDQRTPRSKTSESPVVEQQAPPQAIQPAPTPAPAPAQ